VGGEEVDITQGAGQIQETDPLQDPEVIPARVLLLMNKLGW